MPNLLLGTIVGVYLNVTFPSYLIVFILTFTLVIASYRTAKKAIEMYQKEKIEKIEKIENNTIQFSSTPPTESESEREELIQIHQEDSLTFPYKKILVIIFVFVVLMVIVVLKGNQHTKSIIGVVCGTWQFWLLLFSAVPFVVICTFFISRNLIRKHYKRMASKFQYMVSFLSFFFYFYFFFLFLFLFFIFISFFYF